MSDPSPMSAPRPWLGAYPEGVPADIDVAQYPSVVHLLEENLQKYADGPMQCFMDKELSFSQTVT